LRARLRTHTKTHTHSLALSLKLKQCVFGLTVYRFGTPKAETRPNRNTKLFYEGRLLYTRGHVAISSGLTPPQLSFNAHIDTHPGCISQPLDWPPSSSSSEFINTRYPATIPLSGYMRAHLYLICLLPMYVTTSPQLYPSKFQVKVICNPH
jgi:hypothetical protein